MLFISNYFNSDTDFHIDQQLKMLCSFNEHVPCNPQGEYAENNFKTILQSLKTTNINEYLKESFNDDELQPGTASFGFSSGLYETFRTKNYKPILLEPPKSIS